jgi:hypothetical protein
MADDPEPVCGVDYSVRWARLGPVVRIMGSQDRLRVSGGIGAGAVIHQLNIANGHESGYDPFLLLEIGVAANWGRFLFGLDLYLLFDGTRGINSEENLYSGRQAFDGRTLSFLGLGVRGGLSEWGGAL